MTDDNKDPAMRQPRARQRDHWAVTVWRNGEQVVTIESNCLTGRDLRPGDEDVIQTAAHNLLGFIGKGAAHGIPG